MHLGSLETGDMKRLPNRREKMLLSEIGSQVKPLVQPNTAHQIDVARIRFKIVKLRLEL
jgi:hypothetical protein